MKNSVLLTLRLAAAVGFLLSAAGCALLLPPSLWEDLRDFSYASLPAGVYVSPAGDDSHTGLHPGAPLRSLPAALERAAQEGLSYIYLASGDYDPGDHLQNTGYGLDISNRNGLTLWGGWQSDFKRQYGNTILDGRGTIPLLRLTASTNITLRELTLANGYHTLSGGGIYIQGCADIVISNCSLSHNRALLGGGGLYMADSQGEIWLTAILSNYTGQTNHGGGLFISNSSLLLSDSIIAWCTNQYGRGSGIALYASVTEIRFSYLQYNTGSTALHEWDSTNYIHGNILQDNRSLYDIQSPSALFSIGCWSMISNNLFLSNVVTGPHTYSTISLSATASSLWDNTVVWNAVYEGGAGLSILLDYQGYISGNLFLNNSCNVYSTIYPSVIMVDSFAVPNCIPYFISNTIGGHTNLNYYGIFENGSLQGHILEANRFVSNFLNWLYNDADSQGAIMIPQLFEFNSYPGWTGGLPITNTNTVIALPFWTP